jgi:hypothetical protein
VASGVGFGAHHLLSKMLIPLTIRILLEPRKASTLLSKQVAATAQSIDDCPIFVDIVVFRERHTLNQILHPDFRVQAMPGFLKPTLDAGGNSDWKVMEIPQWSVVDCINNNSANTTLYGRHHRRLDIRNIRRLFIHEEDRWSVFTLLAPIALRWKECSRVMIGIVGVFVTTLSAMACDCQVKFKQSCPAMTYDIEYDQSRKDWLVSRVSRNRDGKWPDLGMSVT